MAEIVTQFTSDFWVTLLAGFLILLFYRYCVAPFTFFRRLGIRGPTPLPLLGNSGRILLDQNIAPKLHREWCSMYGRVFGMYFFRQPFLMMADPEMIRDVLVKEFPKFHDRKNSLKFRKPYDKMMAIVGGKKWKDIRSTLSPTFSAAKMKQMMALMNEAVGTLMQKGDKISRTGEIVDIYSWFQSLTMEIILSTAFGVKAETQTVENDPITEMARKATTPHPLIGVLLLLPFGDWLSKFVPDPFDFEKREDMLQLMLDAKNETGGEKIDYEDILAQTLVFLIAGYETTSATLGFVCYHLAVDTHVQDKLRNEIDRLWPTDEASPSYDVLRGMEYLDMVINETLRMYPPGFITQRDCNETCTIKGITIPKGLPVMIPIYAIHHDPEFWPEPERFDPERFTEAEKAKRSPYAFLPFGHGPRNCIGMRFALLEIKLTLVRLLKKYKLERTEKTAVPLNFAVGVSLACPSRKIMLRVSKRE